MYIVDKKNKIKQKAKIITRSNLAQQGYKSNQIIIGEECTLQIKRLFTYVTK